MALQAFDSDGVTIAYLDEGTGDPVLLIHGFASNHKVNWAATSWVRDLVQEGFRVVAIDNRGHGESGKPHDPGAYGTPAMAQDARRLLDRLGIARAHVVGYSMGARIAAFLTLAHPDRVRALVLSGLGEGLVKGVGAPGPIAAALRAPSAADVDDQAARGFRLFADQTGADREALAACITASRQTLTPEELARIARPVLVAVGTEDDIAGDPHALASLIPGAAAFAIPGRDHMKAVGDRAHKRAVIDFLKANP